MTSLTPDGGRTGQVKERSAVHRDGDWHGTAHIWLVRRQNGRLQVLLQKRSRKKETFPGCFDTSCAGHLSAGDSFEEGALRELAEELGIRRRHRTFFSVGLYSYEVKETFGGTDIIDREIAAVYLYQKPVAFPSDAAFFSRRMPPQLRCPAARYCACRRKRWSRSAGWTLRN